MYLPSSCTDLTPQGRAIHEASVRFGNGQTLPFSPCKRGYIPIVEGERKYACHLHHEERMRRVNGEGGIFRPGEVDLSEFWNKTCSTDDTVRCKEEMQQGGSIAKKVKLSSCKRENTNTVTNSATPSSTTCEKEEIDRNDT